MSNLDKDVDACLKFLIANQKDWLPEMNTLHDHKVISLPLTLIGRMEPETRESSGLDRK